MNKETVSGVIKRLLQSIIFIVVSVWVLLSLLTYFLQPNFIYFPHNKIKTIDDLYKHPFISFIDDLIEHPQLKYLVDVLQAPNIVFKSNSFQSQYQAISDGMGLGFLHDFVAAKDKNLKNILENEILITREYWMIVHKDMKHLSRISAVSSFFTKKIKDEQE